MSAVAVDTSVLLAIFKGEPNGAAWLECLRENAEKGALLISPVVLAEVRSFFPSDGKTILPDFLVAAHASRQARALATEDRGYLRRYFPTVRLLAFPSHP